MKIKNLKRDGRRVYWTYEDEFFGNFDYCTNGEGEGVWVKLECGDWHQIVGTCQFGLKQKTMSGVRKAIMRYHEGRMI